MEASFSAPSLDNDIESSSCHDDVAKVDPSYLQHRKLTWKIISPSRTRTTAETNQSSKENNNISDKIFRIGIVTMLRNKKIPKMSLQRLENVLMDE